MAAARPVWSGAIAFGMVSIPVKLVPAVRRRTIQFHQLDGDSMARIRYRKVSDATGDEVPAERIVRAASIGRDHYVVIDDADLDALAPERSRELAIETFVEDDAIDPLRFDATYHALPDEQAKPYALLAHALGGTGRVGLGRFVMRRKEYLAAIRSDGRHLQVSTLAFADEVVDTSGWDEFEVLDRIELTAREQSIAETLVEAMSGDTAVLESVDEYRAAVDALIAAKADGSTVTAETEVAPRTANVVDLAAALEASLEGARAAKQRHPSARAAGAAGDRPAKKRAPAQKRAAATRSAAADQPAKQPARKRRAS